MRKKQHFPKLYGNTTPKTTTVSAPLTPSCTNSQIHDTHILTETQTSDEFPLTSDQLLSRSVDYTITDSISVQEMKETIEQLRTELISSQNELDNTLMENSDLRKQITKLNKENSMLKTLCQSPLHDSRINRSSKKESRYTMQSSLTPTRLSTSDKIKIKLDYSNTITTLHQRIAELQQQLKESQTEIMKLMKQTQAWEEELPSTRSMALTTPNFNDKMYSKDTEKQACDNRILIFGTQQCVGLAAALIRS
ncbi:unnamed protein product [Parnassius apollo]|uniref:(apollo) hypothetical protein n=1 Tax=Parnassius apollo TaxID=110799 RepID=A0A8S3WRL2_PARAO|nr:unnamed protein product [Parnassius apollo]